MGLNFINDIPVVRLRAFRAIDEPETCQKFLAGHKHVLVNFGIEMITSAKDNWIHNPGVFVLVVESLDGSEVYGGMRLHFANGLYPLPLEDAVGYMDSSIYDLIKEKAIDVAGESCGLWNSRLIAGYGIGSVFLTRAATSLAALLGAKYFFTLCAPYTVKMAEALGMTLVKSLGHDGTFYYPKMDLLATVLVHEDLQEAKLAEPETRKVILDLIHNPVENRIENLRRKEIEIHYSLIIPGINPDNIKDVITGKI